MVGSCSTSDPVVTFGEPDGVLDCETDETWTQQPSVDPLVPGESDSAFKALELFFAPYQQEYELDNLWVVSTRGALVVEGREVMISSASELPAGGWGVDALQSCGPYRPLG